MSNRGCDNSFCGLNPGLLTVFVSLFVCPMERGERSKIEKKILPLGKEKQVKLLKIDFQKVEREHIFHVFGAFVIR